MDIGEDSHSFTQPEIDSLRAGTPRSRDTIAEPREPEQIKNEDILEGIASPPHSAEKHVRVASAQEFSLERVAAAIGDLPLSINTSVQRDGPTNRDNGRVIMLQNPSIFTLPTTTTTTTVPTSTSTCTAMTSTSPDLAVSQHGRAVFQHESWSAVDEQNAYPFVKSDHAAAGSFPPSMTWRGILAHFPTLRSLLKHIEPRYVNPDLLTNSEYNLYLDGYEPPEGKEEIWAAINSAYTDRYNRQRDKTFGQLERAREQAILEESRQRLSIERRRREETEAVRRSCLLKAAAALPESSDDSSDELQITRQPSTSSLLRQTPAHHIDNTLDHSNMPHRRKLVRESRPTTPPSSITQHLPSPSSYQPHPKPTNFNFLNGSDIDKDSDNDDHISDNDTNKNDDSAAKATIVMLKAQLAALSVSPTISDRHSRMNSLLATKTLQTSLTTTATDSVLQDHHSRDARRLNDKRLTPNVETTNQIHYTSIPHSPTPSSSTHRAVLVYVNPTNKLDTFLYHDCDWFSAHAMDHVHPDERFRCLFGGPNISPCTIEHLPSLDPKVFRPRGGELLCKNNECLQLYAARAIHTATKPDPWDGVGCFVEFLNLFISWLSRSGHDLRNYLAELRMSLVSERLRVRLNSVLDNPKYKAYCALAGEDRLCYNVSFYRWMECHS